MCESERSGQGAGSARSAVVRRTGPGRRRAEWRALYAACSGSERCVCVAPPEPDASRLTPMAMQLFCTRVWAMRNERHGFLLL